MASDQLEFVEEIEELRKNAALPESEDTESYFFQQIKCTVKLLLQEKHP
jgi:hypothetical protein